MTASTLTLSLLAAGSLVLPSSAADDRLAQEAQRWLSLADVSVQQLDTPDAPGSFALVDVELEGLPFTLDLRPHSLHAPGFQLLEDAGGGVLRPVDPGPTRTVRGAVLEDPGSIVAGSILEDGLHAKIMLTSGDMYWIEPLAGRVPSAAFGDHAVYHQDDVLSTPGLCGTERLADGAPGYEPPPGDEGPAGAGYPMVAELACDADFQFFNSYGSVGATENRINLVINTMNTQYEDDVRITHLITTIIVRTSAGGGGYTSSDPSTLLAQFRSEWISNQGAVQRDVAQLFTGKNLNGNVIGIAMPSGICSSGTGYNLVQSNCCGSLACATDLSAHELGHTWSSGHCSCSGWTMNPSLTCANRFHPDFTIDGIVAYRNTLDCLDNGISGDVLFSDDFESGNFNKGGWTISSATRCVVKKSAGYEGLKGAKLKKGGQGTPACTVGTQETWIEAPTVDTSGYATVTVLLDAHVRNNTLACEYLAIQWWDGAMWSTAGQVEKHGWDIYAFALPAGAAGNPALRVRLQSNCKGAKERAEVDNFCIIAE